VRRGEEAGVRGPLAGKVAERRHDPGLQLLVEPLPQRAEPLDLFGEAFPPRGVPPGQLAANAVASQTQVAVGRVPAIADPAGGEKLEDASPRDVEQRTHDPVAARFARTREARQAPAPLASDQMRLQNVVLLVRRRDAIGACLVRGFQERFVAHGPGRRLRRQAKASRNAARVPPLRDEG
jgi:hypothetical protein